MVRRIDGVIAVAYGVSFFSGAAALVYQVTWVKMLTLSFGSTTLAVGAITGSIMAGMGLGARMFDMAHRRLGQAFVLYALLELGIAASTAATPLLFYRLPHLYAWIAQGNLGPTAMTAVRLTTVFLILLVPSALMGATFPALCVGLIRSPTSLRRHLGMVYGLNTIGAGAGTVATGFVLIEALGNRTSIWGANLVNVGAGFAALWLWRKVEMTDVVKQQESTERGYVSAVPSALLVAVLFGSGFVTIAYEVCWIRALKYIVGNNTYAVSTVLVNFLFGLGMGGVLWRRLQAWFQPASLLVGCQIAIAILALAAMQLEAFLLTGEWFAERVTIFSPRVMGYPWQGRILVASIVSVALIAPPTLAMGLSFPLASSLYVKNVRRLGAGVGTAYLFASLGSALGAIGGASLLLPVFGTGGSTKLCASINLLLGLALLAYVGARTAKRIVAPAVAVCVALALTLPQQIPFRGEGEIPGSQLLFWKEGDLSTVKVVEPVPGVRTMTIDGFSIAVDGTQGPVAFKQRMLAHFPMLLVPDARSSLVLGLGSGQTLARLAAYPTLERLDCVEIAPTVIDGAHAFEDYAVLDDPRVTVHVDDAVHFLLTRDTRYQVIVADAKLNPTSSSNSPILTHEFHRLCLEHLADDGVLVEWISPSRAPRTFQIAVRTFCNAFPEVAAYFFTPHAVALVGSKRSLDHHVASWPQYYAVTQAHHDLAPFGYGHPMSLLAARVAEGHRLRAAVGPGATNTWDHPMLEFTEYKDVDPSKDTVFTYRNLRMLHAAEQPHRDQSLIRTNAEVEFLRDGYNRRRRFLTRLRWQSLVSRR